MLNLHKKIKNNVAVIFSQIATTPYPLKTTRYPVLNRSSGISGKRTGNDCFLPKSKQIPHIRGRTD